MADYYCFFKMDKIKSGKEFKDRYKHNFREYNVTNADPARQHLNKEVVDLNGKTYEEAMQEAESEMRVIGALDKPLRKDAVRGIEIVLRYSPEADGTFSQDEWVAANVEWLRESFNPPDGLVHYTDENGVEQTYKIDNVKSVVVHNDEGVPHIHAFITPINDKGHFNSNYYFGSRKKMIELQNSYARKMERFNLKRGEYKSPAVPEQITRYMGNIRKAAEAVLPEPKQGESIDEYFNRANIVYQDTLLRHRNEVVRQNQENIKKRSEMIRRFEKEHEDSWENKKKMRKLARAYGKEYLSEEEIDKIIEKKDFQDALEEAVKNLPPEFQESVRRLQEAALEEIRRKKKRNERTR